MTIGNICYDEQAAAYRYGVEGEAEGVGFPHLLHKLFSRTAFVEVCESAQCLKEGGGGREEEREGRGGREGGREG